MLRLKRAIGICLLASALLPTVAAQATTYYVATTGNDSNPGTKEKPWQTVAYAASKLVAGDTAFIMNGTYNSDTSIRIRRTGTQAAPIKLLAYPGHAPVIHFNDTDPANPKLLQFVIQETPGHNKPIAYITIEGFTFEGGAWAIHGYACNHCTIRRNWFKDQYGSAIIMWSAIDTVIDRNIVSDGGSPEKGGHGIYLAGSRYVITNNLIYGSQGYGIQMNGTMAFNAPDFPSQDYSDTKDALIANNVLAYSKKGAGIVIWGPRVTNARIENNIFYENWQSSGSGVNGINWVRCCSTGVQIRNNIFYATAPGATAWIGGAVQEVHYTQSGNLVNTDNPQFTNAPAALPASPNFALNERSPAIDKGLLLTTTRIDFDGTTRPQGRAYDIGAYEYSAGNNTKSPAAPIALQVN